MSVVNSTIGSVPEGTTAEKIVIVNSTVDGTLTTNTAENAAVMVGGKTYETLGAAITAAKAGDTIYVLKDITIPTLYTNCYFQSGFFSSLVIISITIVA